LRVSKKIYATGEFHITIIITGVFLEMLKGKPYKKLPDIFTGHP